MKSSLINWRKTYQIFNDIDKIKDIIGEISDSFYFDNEVKEEVKRDDLDYVFKQLDNFNPDSEEYLCKDVEKIETTMGQEIINIRGWGNGNERIQILQILDNRYYYCYKINKIYDSEDSIDSEEIYDHYKFHTSYKLDTPEKIQYYIKTNIPKKVYDPHKTINRLKHSIAKDKNFGYAIIYGNESTFLITGNYKSRPFSYHPSYAFNNVNDYTLEDPLFYCHLEFEEVKEVLKRKTLKYMFDQYQ